MTRFSIENGDNPSGHELTFSANGSRPVESTPEPSNAQEQQQVTQYGFDMAVIALRATGKEYSEVMRVLIDKFPDLANRSIMLVDIARLSAAMRQPELQQNLEYIFHVGNILKELISRSDFEQLDKEFFKQIFRVLLAFETDEKNKDMLESLVDFPIQLKNVVELKLNGLSMLKLKAQNNDDEDSDNTPQSPSRGPTIEQLEAMMRGDI